MKRSLALLVSILVTAVSAGDQEPATSSIAAAQERISRAFKDAQFSPFTAVASRYFTAGDAARVVVTANGVAFDSPSAPGGVADLAFDGNEIWVTPVPGSTPLAILAKRGEGSVEAGGGQPLDARTRATDDHVVRLGRYYLETGARPGSGRAIVYDPDSPVRKSFTGLRWFPAAPALRLRATYTPIERPDRITVGTSRGLQKEYFRVGTFSFEVGGTPSRLVALATSDTPKPGEELFIPFRDQTTNHESYAVGRYLNVAYKGPGGEYVLDFNLAYNPYCAYSPHYNCVVPPRENSLIVAIRAGEMNYGRGH